MPTQKNTLEECPTGTASSASCTDELNGPESMTSRAYSRLRKDIISGTLKPGRKLKIEELRRTYDAGSSPIREALSLLTSDNLVERIDQRGFRVCPVSSAEFIELIKTRCWVDERALRESIANGTSKWEEQVVLANRRLSRIPRSEAEDHFVANAEWETCHKIFHMTLISQCGSSMLLRFCDQLYDQNIRYRQLSGATAYPSRDIVEEHSSICNAILAADADLAAKLLIQHYNQTGDFLKGKLSR